MRLAAKFIVEAGEESHSRDPVTLVRFPPLSLELERPEPILTELLERIELSAQPRRSVQVTLEGGAGLVGDEEDHRAVDPRSEGVTLGKFRSRMTGLHSLLGGLHIIADNDVELLAAGVTKILLPLSDPCGHLAAHQLGLVLGQLLIPLGFSLDWTLVLPTILLAEFGHCDVKRTVVRLPALEKILRLLPCLFLL